MHFLEEFYGPDRVISIRHKKQRKDGMMFYPPSSPQVLYQQDHVLDRRIRL